MMPIQTGNSDGGFTEIILLENFHKATTQVVTKGGYDLLGKMKNSEEEGQGH